MNTGYYEAMFIINTGDDDESSRNAVLDEIVAEVKKHKGTILNIDPLGKKQFCYNIAKKTRRLLLSYLYRNRYAGYSENERKIQDQ